MGETAVQDARITGQALSQRMLILKCILISICLYCPRVNCRFKAFSNTREVNLSLCVGQIFTSRCSRLCYGVDSGYVRLRPVRYDSDRDQPGPGCVAACVAHAVRNSTGRGRIITRFVAQRTNYRRIRYDMRPSQCHVTQQRADLVCGDLGAGTSLIITDVVQCRRYQWGILWVLRHAALQHTHCESPAAEC